MAWMRVGRSCCTEQRQVRLSVITTDTGATSDKMLTCCFVCLNEFNTFTGYCTVLIVGKVTVEFVHCRYVTVMEIDFETTVISLHIEI